MAWTFPGHPAFIDRAADRLRVRRVASDRLKNPPRIGDPKSGKKPFPDISQIGRTVAGMSQELVELGRRNQPVSEPRLSQIAGDLRKLEEAVAIFHVLAAATAAVLDEAYEAYGIGHSRPVRVECDFDFDIDHRNTGPTGGVVVGTAVGEAGLSSPSETETPGERP